MTNVFHRNIPHIDGNWASHVRFRVTRNKRLNKIIKNIENHFLKEYMMEKWNTRYTSNSNHDNNNYESSTATNYVSHDDLHVSLSKLFILREHEIKSFEKYLENEILTMKNNCDIVCPIFIKFDTF